MNIYEQLDWIMFAWLTGLYYDGHQEDGINPVHDYGCG